MANTLTNLIPTMYQGLDVVSRELVGFATAVTRDSKLARVAKGATLTVPVAPAAVAGDIVPGVTAPNDGDQTISSFPLTISKSRYVPIRWNGEEVLGLAAGPGVSMILADQFAQALRTLTNEVETDLYNIAALNASRAYGSAGTAPFGTSGDLTDISNPLMILDDNGAPVTGRRMVLGSTAMNNLRGKQSMLFKVNEAGTDQLLRTGTIGRLEGFDLGYSGQVKSIAAGTGANYTSTNAGFAVGTTVIPLITGTGTVLAGDFVTFAGDTNKYGVAVGVAAPGSITLQKPGLQQAIPAATTALTVVAASRREMAFSQNALVLATRLPALPEGGDMADDHMVLTDPWSNISFDVSVYRQYKQVKYEVGLSWGVGATKAEHIAALLA